MLLISRAVKSRNETDGETETISIITIWENYYGRKLIIEDKLTEREAFNELPRLKSYYSN
jgi:hypothetical protein